MILQQNKKSVNILLTGGGTGGSVAPILAIFENLISIQNSEFRIQNFIWLGTKNGPEKAMVESVGIKFKPIISGKWRRYFSWQNIIDLFKIKLAFWQSFIIMLKWRPDLIISAGSFVSVPVIWAGWVWRVPILIYQLDVRPGLANKLMAPFASEIAVAFEKSLSDYGKKAVLAGAMIRKEIREVKISQPSARQKLGLNIEKPTILVIGGGTGALAINKLVEESLSELIKFYQIIHITGKNKGFSKEITEVATRSLLRNRVAYDFTSYKPFEFVNTDQIIKMYSAADIIISRCGMGVLSELSYLGKPSILIPIPDSHQEDNAQIFENNKAAIILNQKELDKNKFIDNIIKLFKDKDLQNKYSKNIKEVIKQDDKKIISIIENLLKINY